ncbi:MAG TPA: gamma carbonic anhydrase family protein [Candidatus Acidoferrales bacterium]|nr:gamma carbonic anhydrase family protein [Candidatus Acidoferrales bacterium]
MILRYNDRAPQIASTAFIADSADLIGDVTIGEDASVWFRAVLRGDVNSIRVGARSNVQDGSVLHGMKEQHPVILGDDVTVGHNVTLHGCTIENLCLIGMGSIILNGARIGEGSIIAAGSLVPEGTVVPPRSLFMGMPAQFRRHLSDDDLKIIRRYSQNYLGYKDSYLAATKR